MERWVLLAEQQLSGKANQKIQRGRRRLPMKTTTMNETMTETMRALADEELQGVAGGDGCTTTTTTTTTTTPTTTTTTTTTTTVCDPVGTILLAHEGARRTK
jgi:hypothetical protein